jgi:cysteine desulfurase
MNVYADNAAFKPLIPEVKKFIHDFIETDFRNPSAIYGGGRATRRLIEQAREQVAKAIGADAEEIYFTSGASEAINWFCHADRPIYTTTIEHKAALRNANNFIPVSDTGRIDLDVFLRHCPRYGKVVVGWVNNEIGVIQPIKEIVDICHKKHSNILIDATQAIGHIPIDVHELGVDFLIGSFGKLGGLTGSGFLYMRKGICLEPMIKGGGQERGLRASTENILGILAGAMAISIATQDIDIKMSQICKKRDKIILELLQIPKSHLNGDLDNRVCGNINIAFEGIEAESLVLQLDLRGVQVSAGSACNSASIEPSHVLKAIGLSDELARASIRITIDENITDEQIDYMVNTIKDCVAKMRQSSPLWKEITNEDN